MSRFSIGNKVSSCRPMFTGGRYRRKLREFHTARCVANILTVAIMSNKCVDTLEYIVVIISHTCVLATMRVGSIHTMVRTIHIMTSKFEELRTNSSHCRR